MTWRKRGAIPLFTLSNPHKTAVLKRIILTSPNHPYLYTRSFRHRTGEASLAVWETMGLSAWVWELGRCRDFRNESRPMVPSGPTSGFMTGRFFKNHCRRVVQFVQAKCTIDVALQPASRPFCKTTFLSWYSIRRANSAGSPFFEGIRPLGRAAAGQPGAVLP